MTKELLFVPLGGAGEIGMNLNVFGYDDQWIVVDLGVSFGNPSLPGIDLVMPDPSFIEARRDKLLGIVLTHAHEDHLGAVPHLWTRLRCPVYATPFTAGILRTKLAEAGLLKQVPVIETALGSRVTLGPFDIDFLTLTHSIAEPSALAIRTPLGTVFHTGDWKIDPDPLIGHPLDEDALARLGEEGVLAMVCDSTNVFNPSASGSEADVRRHLLELVGKETGRVAITAFASNIARLETLAEVARAHDRHAVLVGRSLRRNVQVARETGYLTHLPPFIDEADAGFLPRDKVLYICTGSQGEPRGAMVRIANWRSAGFTTRSPSEASGSSPRRTSSCMSPVIPAARNWPACTSGSGPRSRFRSMARRATCMNTRTWRANCRCRIASCPRMALSSGWRPARRRSSTG